jgi:hypothetical protein
MCVSIYYNKCNMQHLNNGFDKFKVNDSTHVKMLVLQKNVKKLIKPFKLTTKHWIAYVSIYYNKCKVQPMNNGFNMLKVDGSTHVPCW